MREVPLAAFAAAHSDGAIVVDVREPGEYVGGHVPGATLVPMGQLSSRLHELPKDMPIYLICGSGNRSLAMTSFLMRAGYDAYSVSGGTGAWAGAGRPLVMGSRRNAA
jgi:rhodanese-related sulfurtransferase